ncbi:MAG: hypothetical protein JRG91_09675 [Deltaproteobacteria bacterium]|nr:hypothetical protein [Deltaproteobacteria bacterium]
MKTRTPVLAALACVLCACWRLAPDENDFVLTTCAEDPAVAVVELTVRTFEMRSTVTTLPGSTDPDTTGEMLAGLMGGLNDGDCVASDSPLFDLGLGATETAPSGNLDVIFADGGDPYAGGVFDRRTGEMAFSWEGDVQEWSRRCTPASLQPAAPEYTRAPAPDEIYTYVGRGGVGGTFALADELNQWGAAWATASGDTWLLREFREMENEVRKTGVVNAFAVCGDYEMLAVAMGSGGDFFEGDIMDIKLVFVISGSVDESVLP